jgi:hypothetical protein
MAYRSGTYVAFHAGGTTDFTSENSDIKYFNLMKAWCASDSCEFSFVNSHEKASAVSDNSKKETLKQSLMERLRNSKNFVLILTENTKKDTDWVPFELEKAIDLYKLPIIVVYPDEEGRVTSAKSSLYPKALADRIANNAAKTIHIPFKADVLKLVLEDYGCNASMPSYTESRLPDAVYDKLGYPK